MASPEGGCINPHDKYPGFSPSLDGLNPGEPLHDFFLPTVQVMDTQYPGLLRAFKFGFSCVEFARLTVELFGGPNCARIYWVSKTASEDWTDDFIDHAFVVPVNAPLESQPFNCMGEEGWTVEQVLKEGEDMTDEELAIGWEVYTIPEEDKNIPEL